MIEIKDIQEALKEKKSLFYAGAEINQETYEFLCSQTIENIEMLFEDMPPSHPKRPSHLLIHFKCQRCFSPMTISLTKSQFKLCKCGGFPALMEKFCNLRTSEESEIIHSLNFLDIEKGVTTLKGICNDCIRSLRKNINDKYDEFYSDPLLWVNTHSTEKHSWQWEKIVKLYTYPIGYENHPQGYMYCGVRVKDRDLKSTTDYFDSDYYNWKTIREKTVVERRLTTTREILNELLGNIKNTDEQPASQKKAIKIAEVFIEGLASNTDLSSIMEYVSKETARLLEKIKKNSTPSRILNFGKYKGMPIHTVIEIDPEYIYWALTVVEGFCLTEDELAHFNGEEWKHLVPVPITKESPEYSDNKEDDSNNDEISLKNDSEPTYEPIPF